ncbi:Uncharacterized conserved protein YafD, endonuclease/exonuclease/phosphatase (EEP) superfamily [Neorhodopirellula lusitana]|uniref:Uncharacterized conserved protein YafD, endonuclease/exonuclease/phosphatase (EEP) superfamily n=1 Tax=Neorhodopirellula lusitana TaxID=445327 RepID=A0ABY1Q7J9_9BACT|nr:endonuclease/exonuclease/phosphatase family protein [Neorhodopirellula lusitana]SMP59222.1 Uncharacterized conserved protein YafD, endonuclease/exonuclease/phosphatase (EEP) superfamily [Neorhodopirellula lusitana]
MIHGIFVLLTALLLVGSLLSLSSHPHWFVRAWDFPRIQIMVVAIAICISHFITKIWVPSPPMVSWVIATITLGLVIWHTCRVLPFTNLTSPQAVSAKLDEGEASNSTARLRILVSNLEMENDSYQDWCKLVRAASPDVVIALEPSQQWVENTESLHPHFPHRILRPQDNWYGMMILSRLPIEKHQIRFLVQDDVPSIDATIRMDNGRKVRVIGVHPRPPEPIRDNDATARDAELVLWGEELKDETEPVLIGGDLNDVAWSQTTRLFLRTSGLLDPRRGRGLFNTFHADHWWMRFPLDHVFHSPHFTVAGIELQPHVGSDHFPILIDLQLEAEEVQEHDLMEQKPGDEEEIETRLERAKVSTETRPKQLSNQTNTVGARRFRPLSVT